MPTYSSKKYDGQPDGVGGLPGAPPKWIAGDQVVARDRLPERVVEAVAVAGAAGAPAAAPGRSRGGRRRGRSRRAAWAGIWLGHHDRGAQARLLVEPLGDLPVVDGAGEGDRRVGIVQAVDGIRRAQDRRLDVPGSSSTWRRTVSRSDAAGMTLGTFAAGRPSIGFEIRRRRGRLPGRAAMGDVGG